MRDHLLGFAPVAETAAIAAGDYPDPTTAHDYAMLCADPLDRPHFGAGYPLRALAEDPRARYMSVDPNGNPETPDNNYFRCMNFALPDGTTIRTDKQLARMASMRAKRAEETALALAALDRQKAEAKKRQDADENLLRKQVEAAFDICVRKGVIAPRGREVFAEMVAQSTVCGGITGGASAGLIAAPKDTPLTLYGTGQHVCGSLVGVGEPVKGTACVGGAGIGTSSPLGRALAQQGTSLKGNE